MREHQPQSLVRPDSIADESAALDGERLAGADHANAQPRMAAEFPQQTNANLDAFAVIPWQAPRALADAGSKMIGFPMDGSQAQRPAGRVGDGKRGERGRVDPAAVNRLPH